MTATSAVITSQVRDYDTALEPYRLLRRLYVLLLIEHGTRRVRLATAPTSR
jgi:hypothetical protein